MQHIHKTYWGTICLPMLHEWFIWTISNISFIRQYQSIIKLIFPMCFQCIATYISAGQLLSPSHLSPCHYYLNHYHLKYWDYLWTFIACFGTGKELTAQRSKNSLDVILHYFTVLVDSTSQSTSFPEILKLWVWKWQRNKTFVHSLWSVLYSMVVFMYLQTVFTLKGGHICTSPSI